MEIKAIETNYAGCRFRSRLEARWAVFFDVLQIKWQYEPEGFETEFGWYLPDFKINNSLDRDVLPQFSCFSLSLHTDGREALGTDWMFLEIKGAIPTYEETAAAGAIGAWCLIGDIPRPATVHGLDGHGKMRILRDPSENDSCPCCYGLRPSLISSYFCNWLTCEKCDHCLNQPKQWHSMALEYMGDCGKFAEASRRARSARFEHGEVG
jgi:hypothetical protein